MGEAGIIVRELRWPTTAATFASTSFCATVVPVFGSAWSSSATNVNFTSLPSILVLAAFASSTARRAPFSLSLPRWAMPPVSGPTWPIFTSSTLGAAGFASALAAGFCSPQPASATAAAIRVIPSFMSFMGSPLPGYSRLWGSISYRPRSQAGRDAAGCLRGGRSEVVAHAYCDGRYIQARDLSDVSEVGGGAVAAVVIVVHPGVKAVDLGLLRDVVVVAERPLLGAVVARAAGGPVIDRAEVDMELVLAYRHHRGNANVIARRVATGEDLGFRALDQRADDECLEVIQAAEGIGLVIVTGTTTEINRV